MLCPNCQTDNPAGEQFCVACGTELSGAVPTPPSPTITATPPPPAPAAPAVATLSFDGKDFPLSEGAKFLIAREGTDKCAPDLAIPADDVSSIPVEVRVEGGVVKIRDTGTSVGTRVVKYLAPGEEMEVKPGEMIMLGNNIITVG